MPQNAASSSGSSVWPAACLNKAEWPPLWATRVQKSPTAKPCY